jgi:hypothetical protein
LPAWTTNGNQHWCHPWITSAVEDKTLDAIRLTVRGRQYDIRATRKFTEDPAYDHDLDFELTIEGQLMLGVLAHVTSTEYSESWHSPFVTAFDPGTWVSEVIQLARETRELHDRNMQEFNHEFARSQAKRFGL